MSKCSIGQQLLQSYIKSLLPDEEILINTRPDWLKRLELDIFIPRLKIAFEFQGIQHVVSSWKNSNKLKAQKRRDGKKNYFCKRKKVLLFHIYAFDLHLSNIVSRLETAQNFCMYRLNKYFLISKLSEERKIEFRDKSNYYINYLRKFDKITTNPIATKKNMGLSFLDPEQISI